MKPAALVVLVVAVLVDKGAACSVSNVQCYKNTTRPDDDFLCEWQDGYHSPDAIYTIFMESASLHDSSYATQFNAGNRLSKLLPVEDLSTTRLLDIWVERQVFGETCRSPNISVFLSNSVKYSSPNIQQVTRSSENLKLSWLRVNDNKGSIHEIRWKKINDSWHNKTFRTADGQNNGHWESYTLQLEKHTVYQVQIRRKAEQSLLWSDWSRTSDIPTEIQQPVVTWTEQKQNGIRHIKLKWTKPSSEASFGGVSYNLTLNVPCKWPRKKTITNLNNLKFAATYSEARVSIVAINNVGTSSTQEIIIPPVQHLTYCKNESITDSQTKRKHCLEWYKLVDGETRPATVNILRSNTLEGIKEGLEKFVRYYYFLHTRHKNQWRTTITCPFYSTEGAPTSEPSNLTVLNVTHDSAVLWWRPIPVQEQHGFLMHYLIWISKDGQAGTGHHLVAGNETSFLLRNLKAGSSYTLSIAGRTKIGVGPNSTKTFFTLVSPSADSGLKPAKIILIVCAVVLLLSFALSFVIRRFRSKLLPIIPSPVISAAAMPHIDDQNLKTMTEEVDSVILVRRDNQNLQSCAGKLKHGPSSYDSEVSAHEDDEYEEDEDDVDDDETHFTCLISSEKPSSFQNPNYKGQLLRFPESLEIADKGQMEICEGALTYKNGLFFENRVSDNEGLSAQL